MLIDVGDGQHVFWQQHGNPEGRPAVVLHGGPGSGSNPNTLGYFDLDVYRVVLVDQRQCGRSTPHAADHDTDLSVNTTQRLIHDLERIREAAGIDRWLVLGHSWGTTLGIAYAERHPERVTELVLAAVCLTRSWEARWLYHGAGTFFPAAHARFREGIEGDDLIAAYGDLLNDPDPTVREAAARRWCDWEEAAVDLGHLDRYDDPRFRLCFARIVTHYFRNAGFLADDELLANAYRLHGIPGVLVHGRVDITAPVQGPWELARAWPDAELHLVDGGHASGDMHAVVIDAIARFARRVPE